MIKKLRYEMFVNTSDFIKVFNNLEYTLNTIHENNRYLSVLKYSKLHHESTIKDIKLEEKISKTLNEKCGDYQSYLINNIAHINPQNYDEFMKVKNLYTECKNSIKSQFLI
jgi:hypothetical protein